MVAVALVVTVACSGEPSDRTQGAPEKSPGSSPSPGSSLRAIAGAPAPKPSLMPLPPRAARRCAATSGIGAICPAETPEIEGRTFLSLQSARRLFSAEWGVGRSGIGRRGSPPHFSHVVVQASDPGTILPFEVPVAVAPRVGLGRRRKGALLLARPHWNDTKGSLVLAPPYPEGGVNGDHLLYLWRADEVAYAVSLHAWLPLRDAAATLRAVVESIRS